MKIINIPEFVIGCINITLAILLLVLIIIRNGRSRAYLACILCFFTGINALVSSIETEKQRQRRMAELKEKAKLYGWDKEEKKMRLDSFPREIFTDILFRAKAINRDPNREYRTNYKNGEWVYGLITTMYDDRFPNLPAEMKNTDGVDGIEVDHRTIGQYTGLTDKNDTKIFEGDIIQVNYHGDEIGRVYIYYKYAMYLCDAIYGDIDYDTLGMLNANYQLEVIGNVYDNPEMIS